MQLGAAETSAEKKQMMAAAKSVAAQTFARLIGPQTPFLQLVSCTLM
jgi:hypothetical protein